MYGVKPVTLLLSILLTIGPTSHADVASDLTDFVNSVGGASTSTSPSIYQGQSRGYINGGRLFVRLPQRSTSLAAFRAPKLTAGCGGIDIFGGSLSFISATELVNTLKAIGSSAGSYALMLGLRTISSQIANTMEKTFDWMQKNLNQSVSSCEAAAQGIAALGGAMGINDTQGNICIIQKMESAGMDYTEAKNACNPSGGSGTKTDLTNDEAKDKAFFNGNLAWIIMDANSMFATDNDLKMMAMSLTGTVIREEVLVTGGVATPVSGDPGSQTTEEVWPSLLLTNPDMIDALLYGSTTNRYECNGTALGKYDCKTIVIQPWTLGAANSLVTKTNDALMRLYDLIQTRGTPIASDIDYVAQTAIPTMRIVRTAALMNNSNLGTQIIADYSEQIAIELLATYISGIIDAMSGYSFEAKYGDKGQMLREGIELVRTKVADIRNAAEISTTRSLQIAEQMQYYERIIISALPRNINRSLEWSTNRGS